MKKIPIWSLGLAATLAVVLIPLVIFWPKSAQAKDDPSAKMPVRLTHTPHTDLLPGPYQTPQDVTRACLSCHPDSAQQVMGTTHWTLESDPFDVSWREEPVTIGKINQINNFCIGSQGNEKKCMSCHTGYAWDDGNNYDITNQDNVDCLVCHAEASTYDKGDFGNPAEGVDLAAAAQSVRSPTRENCGACHFDGGGGNNVKHGDLDESLYFPSENLDVHMGREDFLCTDCHRTTDHQILGRLIANNVVVDPAEQVACTDCHNPEPHTDERLNIHMQSVACQTCHIPTFATKNPTKIYWDWSQAGQERPDDHYTYLKIKGEFIYEDDVQPSYIWFNGNLDYRYLLGDQLAASGPTYINLPSGNIDDPRAKIFPFKIHTGKQPYDVTNNYLLSPITAGTDGYWTNFDWDQAMRLAEPITGLAYSGNVGFADTWMYFPTTHMVQAKDEALQCEECHGPKSRLDWAALGYPGDPMEWGGRFDQK